MTFEKVNDAWRWSVWLIAVVIIFFSSDHFENPILIRKFDVGVVNEGT